MKKVILLFICVLLSVIFVSCNSNLRNNSNQNEASSSKITESETSAENKQSNNKTSQLDENFNPTKIVLSFFDKKVEYTCDDEVKKLLIDIRDCTDVPETNLINKIGELQIKYKDSDEPKTFAILYFGNDSNLYAKYVENSNSNCAYKIDLPDTSIF